MADVNELSKPLRIVCTKCVRIVRVHYQDTEALWDSIAVATECCARTFGFIIGDHLAMYRRGERDLTTADITAVAQMDQRIDAVERYAEECDQRAERHRARGEWARWSTGGGGGAGTHPGVDPAAGGGSAVAWRLKHNFPPENGDKGR